MGWILHLSDERLALKELAEKQNWGANHDATEAAIGIRRNQVHVVRGGEGDRDTIGFRAPFAYRRAYEAHQSEAIRNLHSDVPEF